jgi:hypothetical protein
MPKALRLATNETAHMTRERSRTIAVHFAGVIHRYSKGWSSGSIYDPPIEGARKALARIHGRSGAVILKRRVNPDMPGSERQTDTVLGWLEAHGSQRGQRFDEITHVKPPALAYIDDRTIRFTDWKATLDELGQL